MKGGWGWGARGSTRLVSEFEKTREDARAHLLEAVVGGAGELLLDGFLGAPAEREREVLGGDLLTLGGGFVRARPRRVSFPGGAHRGGGRRARPLLLLLVVGHVAGRRRDVRARVRRRVRPSGVAGKGLAVRRRASRCAGLNRGDRRAKQKCDESVFRNRATRSLATEFRDWKLIRDVDPYFERSCRSSLPSRRGGAVVCKSPRERFGHNTRAPRRIDVAARLTERRKSFVAWSTRAHSTFEVRARAETPPARRFPARRGVLKSHGSLIAQNPRTPAGRRKTPSRERWMPMREPTRPAECWPRRRETRSARPRPERRPESSRSRRP